MPIRLESEAKAQLKKFDSYLTQLENTHKNQQKQRAAAELKKASAALVASADTCADDKAIDTDHCVPALSNDAIEKNKQDLDSPEGIAYLGVAVLMRAKKYKEALEAYKKVLAAAKAANNHFITTACLLEMSKCLNGAAEVEFEKIKSGGADQIEITADELKEIYEYAAKIATSALAYGKKHLSAKTDPIKVKNIASLIYAIGEQVSEAQRQLKANVPIAKAALKAAEAENCKLEESYRAARNRLGDAWYKPKLIIDVDGNLIEIERTISMASRMTHESRERVSSLRTATRKLELCSTAILGPVMTAYKTLHASDTRELEFSAESYLEKLSLVANEKALPLPAQTANLVAGSPSALAALPAPKAESKRSTVPKDLVSERVKVSAESLTGLSLTAGDSKRSTAPKKKQDTSASNTVSLGKAKAS